MKKILICGAGIAGLSLARQFKKLNIPFILIEKRKELLSDGTGIALPANAVRALKYLGLGKPLEKHAHKVNKIIYADFAGNVLSEASLLDYPLNSDHFVALSRHVFHDILHHDLNVDIHFDTTINLICQGKSGVLVNFNGDLQQEEFSAVIGADGVNSIVRQLVFSDHSLLDLGVTIWRWTCRYPTNDLQPAYLFGADSVFMAYPIGENEVYCYAQVLDPENLHANTWDHQSVLQEQFSQYGGIAKKMLELLPDNYSIIPGRLRSVQKPLFTSGRVALIGDAGHACSPMLQQGAAAALEDVIILSNFLNHFSIEDAFSYFEINRSERINNIVTASDGPMKMLINRDPTLIAEIYEKIRNQGPFNVAGWKKILMTDPLREVEEKTVIHLTNEF